MVCGGLACGLFFLIWLAFPQPDPSLWPPAVRNDAYRVSVTIDGFHSFIDFPDFSLGLFQEWQAGAKDWYLTANASLVEVGARALGGSVPGVIRFGVFLQPYWERNHISPDKVFSFWLSAEGFRRLGEALHRYRGHERIKKGEYWYFPYQRGYYLLQNCNAFTASALREAGLPLREILAQEGLSMTWQLERCARLQDEMARPKPAPTHP